MSKDTDSIFDIVEGFRNSEAFRPTARYARSTGKNLHANNARAVVYYKTQNLWAGIIIHTLNNFLISAQGILEHVLMQRGLVDEAADFNQIALMLGVPGLLLTVSLGYYLVKQRQFFNLKVPLYP